MGAGGPAGGQSAEGGTSLAWGPGTPPSPHVLAWSLLLPVALSLNALGSLSPTPATSAIGLALAALVGAAFVARPEDPHSA